MVKHIILCPLNPELSEEEKEVFRPEGLLRQYHEKRTLLGG